MAGKKKRYSSVSQSTPRDGGGSDYAPNGSIVGDPEWPGSATLFLEVDTGRKDDNGNPVRAPLTVGKYVAPDTGEEIFVDYEGSYLNLTFWHEVARSPKADK